MADKRLDEIRERLAETPRGPWRWVQCYKDKDSNGIESLRADRLQAHGEEMDKEIGVPTAEDFPWVLWGDKYDDPATCQQSGEIRFHPECGDFIANAREDIDYLLKVIDGLKAQVSELRPQALRP